MSTWLSRPSSSRSCVVGWILASVIFVVATQLWGGPTYGDANVSVFAAWALAHGHLACAYPAAGVTGYAPTAPVYPLLTGALTAILRVGHTVAFPSSEVLGPHCQHAVLAMTSWALHSHAWTTTLRLGYLSWIVLLAGSVTLLRSFDLGRSVREIVLVMLLALTPSVSMCLWQYFHPQDLLAMGLILAALAAARRQYWSMSGVLFAVALLSQQFSLLLFIPLCLIAPRERRARFLGAALATGLFVVVPLTLATSGRSVASSLLGTGFTSWTQSLLVETGLRSAPLFTLSRVLPIVMALVVAWWLSNRLAEKILEPVPLLCLLALSLSGRLIFEINLWGYYFMAVSVALILLDLVSGHLRLTLLAWLSLVSFAAFHGLSNGSRSAIPLAAWQVVLVGGAVALATTPLVRYLTDADTSVPLRASSMGKDDHV